MRAAKTVLAAAVAGLCLQSAAQAAISGAEVRRADADTLDLSWSSPDPVDVYLAERADAPPAAARLLARGSTKGAYVFDHADRTRRYFLLVDARDHEVVKTAERVLPLAQGSNFRDIGGYPAAGGKHVRWGLIYRSGGQAMLTAEDLALVRGAGVAQVVDLRSKEERVLAPTAIDGAPYSAIGYSMADILPRTSGQSIRNGAELYRRFPRMLAPHLRILFADLLERRTPIVYNCSAGQDRTGFATAVILSALGVPREVIYADYKLSTTYRRPQFEMPHIDPAAHPNEPVAQMFVHLQDNPAARTPQPLIEADGRPFLSGALEEIDAKWGSIGNYLRQEVGLSDADLATLRRMYLE